MKYQDIKDRYMESGVLWYSTGLVRVMKFTVVKDKCSLWTGVELGRVHLRVVEQMRF